MTKFKKVAFDDFSEIFCNIICNHHPSISRVFFSTGESSHSMSILSESLGHVSKNVEPCPSQTSGIRQIPMETLFKLSAPFSRSEIFAKPCLPMQKPQNLSILWRRFLVHQNSSWTFEKTSLGRTQKDLDSPLSGLPRTIRDQFSVGETLENHSSGSVFQCRLQFSR